MFCIHEFKKDRKTSPSMLQRQNLKGKEVYDYILKRLNNTFYNLECVSKMEISVMSACNQVKTHLQLYYELTR